MTPRKVRPSAKLTPARGLFSISIDPPAVEYAGQPLLLYPAAALILCRLASVDYIDKATLRGKVTNDLAMRVHLSAIRRVLPPGVAIVSEYGQGYRLTLPA